MTWKIPEPGIPGEPLLIGVVGSMASGLNRPGSDTDRAGMYAAPTVQFALMGDPPRESVSWMDPDPDLCVYEVGKYAKLLLGCNPAAVEMLWLPEYDIRHPLADILIQCRTSLVSAQSVHLAYMGAARSLLSALSLTPGPLTRMHQPDVREKTARKMLYVLWQGLALYRTGELPIRVEDPEFFYDFGRRCAPIGEWRHAEEMLHRYSGDFAAQKSPLRPGNERPRAFMRDWVEQVRDRFAPNATLRSRLTGLADQWRGQHRVNPATNYADQLHDLLEDTP